MNAKQRRHLRRQAKKFVSYCTYDIRAPHELAPGTYHATLENVEVVRTARGIIVRTKLRVLP